MGVPVRGFTLDHTRCRGTPPSREKDHNILHACRTGDHGNMSMPQRTVKLLCNFHSEAPTDIALLDMRWLLQRTPGVGCDAERAAAESRDERDAHGHDAARPAAVASVEHIEEYLTWERRRLAVSYSMGASFSKKCGAQWST